MQGILLKDFGDYAEATSNQVKQASLAVAERAGQPVQYLASSKVHGRGRMAAQDEGIVKRKIVLSIVLAGCGSKAPAPASSAEEARTTAEEARTTAEAPPAPPSPSATGIVLGDTPTQRELAWIVDVLGRRHGVINTVEIDQHWDSSKLRGPVAVQSLIAGFRRWGADTTNAIVDKIEVDDPAYLRAYVTAGDKRWRVVLSLEPSSMKLDFLQWDVVRDAGTGNAR